jgi:hypothetical protein
MGRKNVHMCNNYAAAWPPRQERINVECRGTVKFTARHAAINFIYLACRARGATLLQLTAGNCAVTGGSINREGNHRFFTRSVYVEHGKLA